MRQRERYENSLLTVRFTGERFSTGGVSIYDLSETLLSVQRIVHKAYLSQEGRLEKGAFPRKDERPSLALQLGERKRASDAFGLVPILTDASTLGYLKTICEYAVAGLVSYYVGDVLDRIRGEKDQNRRLFIGSIHADVVNINNRVEASGGVEGISIGSPAMNRETIASFTADTKEYLSQLKGENFLGPYQELQGKVYKFYPASNIVSIRRSGGRSVSIFLSPEHFREIRYRRETNPTYRFKGHPRYALGIETKIISEFEADEIEYVARES